MNSGSPTILLFPESFWELDPKFNIEVEELKDALVIFNDSGSAANHVNNIYDNPNDWWNSKKTIKARELFYKVFGSVKKNWQSEWINFFKTELKSKNK